MADEAYDQRYLAGIELFNVCDFHEAHDAWEEIWTEYRGPDRNFYKGLIQVAVCLHHFGNGNIRGAKKLFLSSCGYLQEYRPKHLGLDLDKLLAEFTACLKPVMESTEEYPKIEIVPDLIPEIHLS